MWVSDHQTTRVGAIRFKNTFEKELLEMNTLNHPNCTALHNNKPCYCNVVVFFKPRVLKEKRRLIVVKKCVILGYVVRTFCDAVGFTSTRSLILNSLEILMNGTV